MGIPDYQSLMLPVLRLVPWEGIENASIIATLADEFDLSDEERAQLNPSGNQTTFANRVHWAIFGLAKAELLSRPERGKVALTNNGARILSNDPTTLSVNALRAVSPKYDEYMESLRAKRSPSNGEATGHASDTDNDEMTPDEALRAAHKTLTTTLADALLDRARDASPAFFEKLVVNLLLAMGYGGSTASVENSLTKTSGDGGIDGVIDQDPLGLDRVYVQAKRYAAGNTVGAAAIRDFFGSLDRFKAAKGVFITTSTFTRDAQDTASLLSKRIVLVDGDRLARLMIRHEVGCRTTETVAIKQADEEFFDPL